MMINKYNKYLYKIAKFKNIQNGGGVPTIIMCDGNSCNDYFKLVGDDILRMITKINNSGGGTAYADIINYLNDVYSNSNLSATYIYLSPDRWSYLKRLDNDYSYHISPTLQSAYKTSIHSTSITDGKHFLPILNKNISPLIRKFRMTEYYYKWPNLVSELKNSNFDVIDVSHEQFNVLMNLYIGNLSDPMSSSDPDTPDIWEEHVLFKGASVLFTNHVDTMLVKGENIYSLYKKIKKSKYNKKLSKIKKRIKKLAPYNNITIYVSTKELEILATLRRNSLEYIEKYLKK